MLIVLNEDRSEQICILYVYKSRKLLELSLYNLTIFLLCPIERCLCVTRKPIWARQYAAYRFTLGSACTLLHPFLRGYIYSRELDLSTFLIFCSISIFLLASLMTGREPQCSAGALQQGMYSTILIHWNIKSPPASPGRSRVGPEVYVFSLLDPYSGGGGGNF